MPATITPGERSLVDPTMPVTLGICYKQREKQSLVKTAFRLQLLLQ